MTHNYNSVPPSMAVDVSVVFHLLLTGYVLAIGQCMAVLQTQRCSDAQEQEQEESFAGPQIALQELDL